VRLRVTPGVSLDLLGLVDAGELDAAVMIRPPFSPPPELVWRPLWDEPFVLAVPARVKGRDWKRILGRAPFLRYDRHSFGGRAVAQFLDSVGIEVDDAVEMDEIGGLVQLVARGMGVALVPRCRPYFPLPDGVRAIGLGPAGVRREIGMVERVRHPQVPLVRSLHDALRRAPR
jgi:DNA-binding transcriptional LysR family regulator